MESNLYKDVVDVNKHIYSEYSKEYYERTKNGHKNYLQQFIDRFIYDLSGLVVYDLGCGPGRDLEYFVNKGLQAKGVDCSSGMINICKERGLNVVENDFLGMDYEADSVDGIWAYTSHTVIPKTVFVELINKYHVALRENTITVFLINSDRQLGYLNKLCYRNNKENNWTKNEHALKLISKYIESNLSFGTSYYKFDVCESDRYIKIIKDSIH